MPEYYRTNFTIHDDRNANRKGIVLLDDVGQCVRQWAAEEFGSPYEPHFERGEWPNDKGTLRLYNRREDGLGYFQLIWERPSSGESDQWWRLSLRLATDDQDTEVDLEIRGLENGSKATSDNLLAVPPSFLATLFKSFRCSIDEKPLQTKAERIGLNEASAFVQNEMLNADRLMPIIVVSDYRLGGCAVIADELQKRLLGLARVFSYNHNTAWHIARDLPQSLWCYDGAIRLYAPGCSENDSSQQHPYWLPSKVKYLKEGMLALLRDECVYRMSHRVRRRLFTWVRNQIRLKIFESQLEQAQQAPEDKQEVPENGADNNDKYNELHQKYLKEKERADGLNSDAQSYEELLDEHTNCVRRGKLDEALAWGRAFRNKSNMLAIEKQQLQKELEQLKNGGIPSQDSITEQQQITESDLDLPFTSIIDAAKYASENLKGLRFLENAFETAESRYTRILNIHAKYFYRVFKILDECAKERAKGSLGMTTTKWLEDKSVEFSDEAERTKKDPDRMDERTFFDSQSKEYVLMTHHIKLLQNAIRIHLFWKETEKKWLIGYIGDHLLTSSDRT